MTRGDLLNGDWPKPQAVTLANGKTGYVRMLSAGEKDGLEAEMRQARKSGRSQSFRGRLVSLCACKSDGVRLFGDDDAAELSRRPLAWIEPLVDAALEFNGLTEKAVEDAVKNSPTAPASSSGTSLPSVSA